VKSRNILNAEDGVAKHSLLRELEIDTATPNPLRILAIF
jgi:hypothetical protein